MFRSLVLVFVGVGVVAVAMAASPPDKPVNPGPAPAQTADLVLPAPVPATVAGLGLRAQRIPGVVVQAVESGSAAHRAGLLPGDVILKANDQPIYGPQEAFNAAGPAIRLEVLRWGLPQLVLIPRDPNAASVSLDAPFGRTGVHASSVALKRPSGAVRLAEVNGVVRIEADYRDAAGRPQSKRFEGTTDNIRGQIRELPQDLQDAILRHLNGPRGLLPPL